MGGQAAVGWLLIAIGAGVGGITGFLIGRFTQPKPPRYYPQPPMWTETRYADPKARERQ